MAKKKFANPADHPDIYAGWVRVTLGMARNHLAGLLHEIEAAGVGVVVTRHKKDVALLIPISEAARTVQADTIGTLRTQALEKGVDPVEQTALALMERILRREALLPEEADMVARLQNAAQDAAKVAFLDGLRRELGLTAGDGVSEDRATLGSDPSAGTGSTKGRHKNRAVPSA